MTDKPKPGSPEAQVQGCLCPIIDNGHGRGYMGNPNVFVYTEGCPLHWRATKEPAVTSDAHIHSEP